MINVIKILISSKSKHYHFIFCTWKQGQINELCIIIIHLLLLWQLCYLRIHNLELKILWPIFDRQKIHNLLQRINEPYISSQDYAFGKIVEQYLHQIKRTLLYHNYRWIHLHRHLSGQPIVNRIINLNQGHLMEMIFRWFTLSYPGVVRVHRACIRSFDLSLLLQECSWTCQWKHATRVCYIYACIHHRSHIIYLLTHIRDFL